MRKRVKKVIGRPSGIRSALGDLMGRSGRRATTLIGAQVTAADRGAHLALRMVQGTVPPAEARSRMSAIEHDGDAARRRLVQALVQALVTPVDREDLYRLSRSVDDVLDNLRDFVREVDMYQVDDLAMFEPLLVAVKDGLAALGDAIAVMATEPARAVDLALKCRSHATEVRQNYQGALADLFAGELSMETLKRRESLRRLDVVALRLNESADALNDGILKRHYRQ